jgi:hypothetical protein
MEINFLKLPFGDKFRPFSMNFIPLKVIFNNIYIFGRIIYLIIYKIFG